MSVATADNAWLQRGSVLADQGDTVLGMSTVVSPDDVMDAVERAAERLSHEAVRRLLVRAEAAHRLLRADPALDGYELLAAVVWPSEMMERMLEDWLRAEDEAAYHAILVEAA